MPVVLITGGTGLIGKNLTRHLTNNGYEVIILSRSLDKTSENEKITFANWNIDEQQIDGDAIAKADYIIHLAGAGVMEKKWTKKYKKEIVESRTKSSELLIRALQENTNHVKAIISASAIGWYSLTPALSKNGEEVRRPNIFTCSKSYFLFFLLFLFAAVAGLKKFWLLYLCRIKLPNHQVILFIIM